MSENLKPDLFAFVAGAAVERGDPLPITCNCGGVITIMPPLQEELVVCAKCEARIKLILLAGDPGYIIGRAGGVRPLYWKIKAGENEASGYVDTVDYRCS